MQFNMYHSYMVDEHTIQVISNLTAIEKGELEEELPLSSEVIRKGLKRKVLLVAMLLHDIGKGRGGDHSVLGAEDALAFCRRHGLIEADTELVCWLVKKHLYMSSVSQRQDIYDPDVVFDFANEMKSEMRLDYLYALTVADINATNPTLWNSWRATLLRQLYIETRRVLRHGVESLADKATSIAASQERALERILGQPGTATEGDILALWQNLGDDFFLRHTPPQIATLSQAILSAQTQNSEKPFIAIHDTQGDLPGEGATQIYVYAKDQPRLFANTAHSLSADQLSVVDATVNTSPNGMCFDVYTILTIGGDPLPADEPLRASIVHRLGRVIGNQSGANASPQRLLPRQLRELSHPTEVTVSPTPDGSASVLTIIANDRPGLLATIAEVFVELDLHLLSAKITTLGERVEDTFVVTDAHNKPIASGEISFNLQQSIRQHLDVAVNQNN